MALPPGRILGLDYGDKTIGVAVSDPLRIMALGVETIRRERENALRASFRRLRELIDQYTPLEAIVLGYPKNMNNTEGERCAKTMIFKGKIAKNFPDIQVILWDERLSTVWAKRELIRNRSKMPINSVVDEMAAVFILQGYMDFKETYNGD